jgi:hypothetical protein
VTNCDAPGDPPAGTYHREALEALWKSGAAGGFFSFVALRGEGGMRAHAGDLARFALERRRIQPLPAHVEIDPARFEADPDGALRVSFHAFSV